MIKKSLFLLCSTLMLGLLLAVPGRLFLSQASLSTPVYLPIALREFASQSTITPTPTRTNYLIIIGTRTPTRTGTRTPTRTGTRTPTRTGTRTPTRTGTRTPTRTPTPTYTSTPSYTPTFTSTPTLTPSSTPTPTSTSASLSAIVVDHTDTDASIIPEFWLEQAKLFVVHYAHTSHGSQVLSGLSWLESRDSRYNVDIEASGTVVLPDDTTALRIYDGNNYPGNTYITPDLYWETQDGITHTRSVADTGWFDFSLWTWCGQASSYTEIQIQNYLDVMAGFETEYPGMRFIYYTGHSDGTAPGSILWRNNDMIRQYVQDNQKVLFDFNDMEVYAPDGSGPYYNNSDGYCEWCDDWCTDHPTAFECQNLPSCAHTHGLFCTLKGQAFWVLMARLAGWDGTP